MVEVNGVEFVNLTPHDVVIFLNNQTITIPASGTILRVQFKKKLVGWIAGIPVYRIELSNIDQLPPKKPNRYYIVSFLTLWAIQRTHKDRDDFLAPDTTPGSVVRDSLTGRIMGVRGFQK